MRDEPNPPSSPAEDGHPDRLLDRWLDSWQDPDSVLPRPTVEYQGIDWADIQAAHGEAHAGRV